MGTLVDTYLVGRTGMPQRKEQEVDDLQAWLDMLTKLHQLLTRAHKGSIPTHVRIQMVSVLKCCIQLLLFDVSDIHGKEAVRRAFTRAARTEPFHACPNSAILQNARSDKKQIDHPGQEGLTCRSRHSSDARLASQQELSTQALHQQRHSQALTSKLYNPDPHTAPRPPEVRAAGASQSPSDKRRASEDDIRQARNPQSKKTRPLFMADEQVQAREATEQKSARGSVSSGHLGRPYTPASTTSRQTDKGTVSLSKAQNGVMVRERSSDTCSGGRLHLVGQVNVWEDYELPTASTATWPRSPPTDITGVTLDEQRNLLYVALASAGVLQLDSSRLQGQAQRTPAGILAPKGILNAYPEGRLIFCMELDKDQQRHLLCGDQTGGVQHFEVETGVSYRYDEHRNSKVLGLDFFPGSAAQFVSCSEGIVNLWDVRTGSPHVSLLDMGDKPVTSVRVNPDNPVQILVGAANRFAYMFDARKSLVVEDATHSYRCVGSVSHMAFPSNDEVLCSTNAGQLRLFDLDRQSCLRVYSGHYETSRFTGLAVSPGGEVFACGGGNYEVVLYHRSCTNPFARYSFSPEDVQRYYCRAEELAASFEVQGNESEAQRYADQLRLLQNRFSITCLEFASNDTLLCGTSKGSLGLLKARPAAPSVDRPNAGCDQ